VQHRIVFDESHMVKTPSCGQSKTCVALHSVRRWCCTGTPVSGSAEDLYGQFMVMKLPLLTNKALFDMYVRNPFTVSGRFVSPHTLMYVLGRMLIRHTKLQVLGGEEVLKLPPKTEELVPGEHGYSLSTACCVCAR
jgi:SWI/SNF-related matrix-associated actin-dependent regulator of chromatin subfamily A3